MSMFPFPKVKNIIYFIVLTPVIVILLTIGWYQQAIHHNDIPQKMLPPRPDDSYVIAGYFVNWGIYQRNFNVVDLKADKLSHILYAFANVNADGSILLGDAWADTDIRFTQEKTVDGVVDGWKEVDEDLHGNFKQLALLKQRNRHLKVSLSVGGYTWSANFSAVAASPKARATFANSAVTLLKDLGLDGIDIDWEYPATSADADNYVLLLREVRAALDEYQLKFDPTDEKFLLSVAVPCGPEHYRLLKLERMAKYVDLFYLMAYDFAGSWDKVTGHQSNLYGGDFSVDQAVNHYAKSGVPTKKIVMGMPLYGRGFLNTGLTPGSAYQGVPKGSWEPGNYDYKDLPPEGSKEYYDEKRVASWSYNERTREFVTYDSPTVTKVKCDYIKQRMLGGAMFWELSGDVPDNSQYRSLLSAAYDFLERKLNRKPNHILFPQSKFKNIPHSL
ncbi:chitinase [Mycotypha africana]|uniref:chitinase n=1 Tax=Mycotypha africana TaxID=64632 RepID=UPI0022FFF376|nr:chitinase [Mycotypha africana]KAI8969989.1 chitinase [Mycotypha africana]